MNLKYWLALVLLLSTSSITAETIASEPKSKRIFVPVLVTLDEKGVVKETKWDSKYDALGDFLDKQTRALAFESAKIADRAVSSEFAVRFVLDATPVEDKRYNIIVRRTDISYIKLDVYEPPFVPSFFRTGADGLMMVEYLTRQDGSIDHKSTIVHQVSVSKKISKSVKKDIDRSIVQAVEHWPLHHMIIDGKNTSMRVFVPIEYCLSQGKQCGNGNFDYPQYTSTAIDPQIKLPVLKSRTP